MADTKACNLTEEEIMTLIHSHGNKLSWPALSIEDTMERLNYLNKRLKAFKEPEITIGDKQGNSAQAVAASTQGWPNVQT